MSGIPAPVSLFRDLLVRIAAVEQLITWTNSEGTVFTVANTVPRRYTKISAPFPQFLNFISRDRLSRDNQRVSDHDVTVTVQCWAGPLSAGRDGEMEERLNYLYMAVPTIFEARPFLPLVGNDEFDYVEPPGFSISETPNGTTGFEVDEGDGVFTRYFGAEWLLQGKLRIPRSRSS